MCLHRWTLKLNVNSILNIRPSRHIVSNAFSMFVAQAMLGVLTFSASPMSVLKITSAWFVQRPRRNPN